MEQARAEKIYSGQWHPMRAAAPRLPLASVWPIRGISGVVLGLAELSHLEEALAAAAMGPLPEDGIAGL